MATSTAGARILVADDDRDIRDLVVFKLEQAGYAVDSVGTAWRPWTPRAAFPTSSSST
jgi:two-component system, OmpR family, response regulator